MLSPSSTAQISRATGPLPGRGIAPPPGSLLRSDLSLDVAAIKVLAKARFVVKREQLRIFPKAARGWMRRILRDARREGLDQRHAFVRSRMPPDLPFTDHERQQLGILKSRMDGAPVNARGNADHKAAAGRHGQIVRNAQRRAYDAILRAGRAQ